MRGGYVHDDDPDGNKQIDNGESVFNNAYNFRFWQYIDYFIYFGHHRVTIPPPSWINCAHRNGVKVMGTFITEWAEGEKENEVLLASDETIDVAVSKLCDIATYFGFDGWFINIEAKLNSIEFVSKMIRFVKQLTTAMHAALPGSKVIWYDSVLATDGALKWQNALNELNRAFFDACDGMFLNYVWTPELLKSSVKEAGEARKFDVIAGIDIFGRGTFGGGGFNTHLASEEIVNQGCSVGLFAPGWTLEREVDCDQKRPRFEASDLRFWTGRLNHCDLMSDKNQSNSWSVEGSEWKKLDDERDVYEVKRSSKRFKTFALKELGFTRDYLDKCPFITVRETFEGGATGINAQYYLIVRLFDEENNVICDYSTELQCDPSKKSQTIAHTCRYTSPGLSKIYWEHGIKVNDALSESTTAVIGPSSLLLARPQILPSIASLMEPHIALPRSLPFITHFNQGVGNKLFVDEQLVSTVAWANMSLQDPQPTDWYPVSSTAEDNTITMDLCYDYAVDGGSSLAFTSVFQRPTVGTTVFRLFKTRIEFDASAAFFGVEVAYLPLNGSIADVGVILIVESIDNPHVIRVNCGCSNEQSLFQEEKSRIAHVDVQPQDYSSTLKIWKRHLYQVDLMKTSLKQSRSFSITEIHLVCLSDPKHHYDLRLGSLKILPLSP